MSRKKTITENPMENKKRAATPPPPFAPPGDYERAISAGAITKDERPPGSPPLATAARGRKLSPQDQHFRDRSEKFKTDRVKKLFADGQARTAQTSGALKPTDDLEAMFEDEDTDRENEPMTMTATSDELGIDVETSITRKHNDDR